MKKTYLTPKTVTVNMQTEGTMLQTSPGATPGVSSTPVDDNNNTTTSRKAWDSSNWEGEE